MADVADYTQQVNVTGGSVSITGTATVQITGTPTVSISGTPTVNVGNTPSVTISSGTVTANISGTPNINIQSQSVTVNVNQPMTALADLVFPAGASTQTTASVPTGTHALGILGDSTLGIPLTIKGHTTGRQYWPKDTSISLVAPNPIIRHGAFMIIEVDSVADSTYDFIATAASGGGTIKVAAVLDTQAVEVSNTSMDPVFIADSTLGGYPPLTVAGLGSGAAAPDINGFRGAVRTVLAQYDTSGTSAPGTGSLASVVLAATGGRTYVCAMLSASITQAAAGAEVDFVTLKDGATIIFNRYLGTTAGLGNGTGFDLSGLALKGTQGNSMTVAFDAGPAGIDEAVNIGAYFA